MPCPYRRTILSLMSTNLNFQFRMRWKTTLKLIPKVLCWTIFPKSTRAGWRVLRTPLQTTRCPRDLNTVGLIYNNSHQRYQSSHYLWTKRQSLFYRTCLLYLFRLFLGQWRLAATLPRCYHWSLQYHLTRR